MSESDDQGRPEPPSAGDELATLRGFLDFQRATLAWKTEDLSDAELNRTLAPSTMTLGGLVRHLAVVEDFWFGRRLLGEPWWTPFAKVDWESDPDWDWRSAASVPGDHLRAEWRHLVSLSDARTERVLAAGGLDTRAVEPVSDPEQRVSLRWILVHMIEEYSRHNGHADLIRESIDGQVGE